MSKLNHIPDYYAVLRVHTDADRDEIKKAFRLRAKEIHPDTTENTPQSLSQMRELLSAYETLIQPDLREAYDHRYRQMYPQGGFDYREFLKSRLTQGDSAGKLIFFDLLHQHEREAMDLYNTLVQEKDFDLSQHLDREDFMDCAFLIAEEYESRGDMQGAFNLFKTLIEFELERPYFRHFFAELLERMRVLLTQRMKNNVTLRQHIDFVLQIAQLPLDKRERGIYMKKLAELYIEAGDGKRARFFIREAQGLNPRQAGLTALERKLDTRAFNAP